MKVIGIVCILIGLYFHSNILADSRSDQFISINPYVQSDGLLSINASHPRIFFKEDDLPYLRQRANTTHSNQWQTFLTYLDEWLDYNYTDAPEWFLDVDVKAFAFGYIITSKTAYLIKTIELMNIMINWDIPDDDMPNRERLLTLSIGYDWTYNDLSPMLRTTIASRIEDYMAWVSEYFNGSHNWFQGHERWGMITLCLGAIATYHELESAPSFFNESSTPIINHIMPIWEYFGSEDGGNYYGTDYEGIVLRDMMYFFESWRSATGEDLIENSQFWPKCVDYRIALTHPNMSQERIDDCWSAHISSYEKVVADWIASTYNRGIAQWFGEKIDEQDADGFGVDRWELWSELLWYDPSIQSTAPNWTAKHFKGIGQVSMRSGWDFNDTIVNFYCGDFGGGHDHYHQNSFTIFKQDELTIHNGAYDSFGSSHHNGYYQRTISSNTITVYDPNENFAGEINDGGQRFIRKEFGGPLDLVQYQNNMEQYECGDILRYYTDENIDYVMGDATNAYRDSKVQDFTRQVVFMKPSDIIIYDRISIANPDWEINWHLHSVNPFEINGSIATTTTNETVLACQVILPIDVTLDTPPIFDVYGTFIPPDNWSGGYKLGEGRLDISPLNPSINNRFLNILSLGNHTNWPSSNAQLLESFEQNASGLLFKNYTIWFANNETKNGSYLEKMSFFALNNSSNHIIFDLEPHARYKLYVNHEFIKYIIASTEGFINVHQSIITGDYVKIQKAFPPIAAFDYAPLNPSINQIVYFNSTSFDPDGFIVNWTWNIGNNSPSYGENIEYLFQLNGTYPIDLTVVDNDSNSDCCNTTLIIGPSEVIDINQSIFNRGFPVRHTWDGDWGAAQNFTPNCNLLTYTQIYIRKFGTPEFNLTVELRTDHPEGVLLDTLSFNPEELASSWQWIELDFEDVTIDLDTNLFIVLPPAPSTVTTSFGYEWGYAFGDQYQPGSFWFTRDGGTLWRDLPTMYEFVFRTFGFN